MMFLRWNSMFLFYSYISMTLVVVVSSKANDDKSSKHFSLFSVVTFQNAECTSDSTITGGATEGTCYTSTECSDKSGMKSGNCASGFGVCCVFLETGGVTATFSENRTRLRNTEFPSAAAATAITTIVYTVNKMKDDICQLRLDFTTFNIAGPANTVESIGTATGTHCVDTLQITTTDQGAWTNMGAGTLCGALTGEHLYVDLTPTATDVATITLVTAATAVITPALAARVWDMKLSQIECYAAYRAPPGCQRYMTAKSGKIISYNFLKISGSTPNAIPFTTGGNSGIELATQNVNTCIRRAKGMCCVEYQVCASYNGIALAADFTTDDGTADLGTKNTHNEGFSIDLDLYPFIENAEQSALGLIDQQCFSDYISIPSSWSAACGAGTSSARGTINTHYCGARFGNQPQRGIAANTVSTPVCDCSEPFVVTHHTDDANDKGGTGAANAANLAINAGVTAITGTGVPRGFCLDYRQTSCWQ
jgi:hypothetical protein